MVSIFPYRKKTRAPLRSTVATPCHWQACRSRLSSPWSARDRALHTRRVIQATSADLDSGKDSFRLPIAQGAAVGVYSFCAMTYSRARRRIVILSVQSSQVFNIMRESRPVERTRSMKTRNLELGKVGASPIHPEAVRSATAAAILSQPEFGEST